MAFFTAARADACNYQEDRGLFFPLVLFRKLYREDHDCDEAHRADANDPYRRDTCIDPVLLDLVRVKFSRRLHIKQSDTGARGDRLTIAHLCRDPIVAGAERPV